MKHLKKHLFVSLVASSFGASVIFAAQSSESMSDVMKNVSATYYSDLEGPSFRMQNKSGSGAGESVTDPVYFYNILGLGYQTSPKAKIKIDVLRFTWAPNDVWSGADDKNSGANQFKVKNPRISFSLSDVWKSGKVSLSSLTYRATPAVLKKSRVAGYQNDNAIFTGWGYDTGAKYSIELGTFTNLSSYSVSGVGPDFVNAIYPTVGYQINSKLSGGLTYYHELSHTKNVGQFPLLAVSDAYLSPQITYSVNKAFTVAPFVRLYTIEALRSDRTMVGVEMMGTIF